MRLDFARLRSKVYCMKILVVMLSGLMLLFISGTTGRAQAPAPPPDAAGPALAPAQLDQLVGPIALYPDPLIAELLPAATFPSEIVEANRYISQGGDPNQIPDQGWDPSVQAMAHYGNVLKWMDDNLAWTTQLGQVFENQQADVMNAIQQLRGQAQNLGNLPSTPQESVVNDGGDIEIDPTDPDQMYVPAFPPDEIYTQPGIYCTFPFWLPIGGWLVNDWNWHNHGLIFWGPDHPRPGNWWHEPPNQRHSYIVGHPLPVWHAGVGGVAVGSRGSWERGWPAQEIFRSYARPGAPSGVAPGVSVIHSGPTTVRSVLAFRQGGARAGGFAVGGQSGREAVESSARGQASRAEMGGGAPHEAAPAPREGGGSPSHGGGFSGGGGGGGGRHR